MENDTPPPPLSPDRILADAKAELEAARQMIARRERKIEQLRVENSVELTKVSSLTQTVAWLELKYFHAQNGAVVQGTAQGAPTYAEVIDRILADACTPITAEDILAAIKSRGLIEIGEDAGIVRTHLSKNRDVYGWNRTHGERPTKWFKGAPTSPAEETPIAEP